MRTNLLTLTLAATLAFASAFAAAKWRPHGIGDESGRGGTLPGAATRDKSGKMAKAAGKTAAPPDSPAGVLQDRLLREALASADLVAAVREIMAHEQEDHCADTRLICLVENLSSDRLGEITGLLEANAQNDFIVRFVLAAWAQRDPAAALAWVQSHPSLNRRGEKAFLTGWMRASPQAALAWVDAQPLSTGTSGLRTAVIEAMAEKNPAAALDLMKSRGWLAQEPTAILKLLQNWGGTDPSAALQGLRELSAAMGLNEKLPMVAIGAGAFQENHSFRNMLGALLQGVFERNPADAKELLAQLSPRELASGQEMIVSEVLARDPDAVKAILNLTPESEHRELLRAIAAKHPALAVAELSQTQDKTIQAEILMAAMKAPFASEDSLKVPEEMRPLVMAAVAALPDEKARAQLIGQLTVENVGTSPAWAAELWASLPVDQQLVRGNSFFQTLGELDAARALEVFGESGAQPQTAWLKSLCSGLASTDPAGALQLVLQQPDGALQAECAATLFAFWAQKQPDAALAALEQHAGALDLGAVLARLPEAGRFPNVSHGRYGSTSGTPSREVETVGVEKRIRALLGPGPSSPLGK